MTTSPDTALQSLNDRRRRAVELRLSGLTLPQIRAETGLSAPTVIGAYRAFLSQGWAGVRTQSRGRRSGVGRRLDTALEAALHSRLLQDDPEQTGLEPGLWTAEGVALVAEQLHRTGLTGRTLARSLQRAGLDFLPMVAVARHQPAVAPWRADVLPGCMRRAHQQHARLLWCGQARAAGPSNGPAGGARPWLLVAQTLRGSLAWWPVKRPHDVDSYVEFLNRLRVTWPGPLHVLLHGIDAAAQPALQNWLASHPDCRLIPCPAAHMPAPTNRQPPPPPAEAHPSSPTFATKGSHTMKLTHLQRLEAESIHIMREVVAEAENPVMLYSVGKDSATMLHLAKKAFYPSPPPFPLLHVDTTWKFRDMYALRDRMAAEMGMTLLTYRNPEAEAMGINPFDHGSQIHTDMWKTQGLKQALDKYGFDAAFGGARRDEEKSRAKERIFSFRSAQHRWDPKFQRPELWNQYNARKHKGESIRVFPISNWTELDIWQYIYLENIPIVPLYYAAERPVVERDGTLIMVDDERMRLKSGEVPVMRKVRFRTLGCYPLTGAIESNATSLLDIIEEMLVATSSERQGRVIDKDASASMENKKQEGYF